MMECLSMSNGKSVRMFKWFAQWSSCSVSELTPWLWSTLRVPNPGNCYAAVTMLNELPISQFYTKVHFGRDAKSVCHIHEQEHTVFWNSLWSAQNLRPPDAEKKTTKPRWHMLSTNSRTHSLPWNISGNQKQTLPLNTVMAFTWKEMHSYWEVWASVSAEEGCLLWGSSVCFYPVPVVSAPFEQASVGIFTWTQRDSASKIYSMEKCNVTIN